MTRAWILPSLLVLSGALVTTALFVRGSARVAVAVLSLFALLAVLHSPLVFPRSVGAAEAQARNAVDGRPIVYWRPGCKYCLRLRVRLGRDAHRLHWVDIWRDPAGAAAVRAANAGDETVPTVLVAGRAHTNPRPAWVRAQL
ncbi:glutaredoxin domain-containing protein [Streptomyces sp. NPDC042638]|uniref:glutaredoxin domain-containing protein n=1 Tax=Streptomyces sp. NPDC042638 TaxID=3154333 RepID=UPI0033F385D7